MATLNYAEAARFLRNVRKTDSCWIWVGPLMPGGYGKHRTGPGARERPAHVIAYEHWVGPIPAGYQADHLCHTQAVKDGTCSGGECKHRRCVNPLHLEAVTASVNTTRQDHAERRKTHCPHGHEYTPDNTIRRDGRRYCRACDLIRKRR